MSSGGQTLSSPKSWAPDLARTVAFLFLLAFLESRGSLTHVAALSLVSLWMFLPYSHPLTQARPGPRQLTASWSRSASPWVRRGEDS